MKSNKCSYSPGSFLNDFTFQIKIKLVKNALS
jgi:hypothetical protein